MFAVVLVGGFGTRLRPLTNEVPKPMLPVAHRPMIVHLVERLAAADVTDVVLALGFKPKPFQEAFPGGSHGDVRIHYVVEPEPLDTAGAIGFAARAVGVDDTFVVANGDIIADLPITDLVATHRRTGAGATLHLMAVEDPSSFGVVELDDEHVVQRFVEKPAPGESTSRLINAGTYVFEPDVLDLIPEHRRWSVERDVFPVLAADRRLVGHPTDDYWLDTGRPEQYLRANLDAVGGVRAISWEAVHPSADVSDDATVDDSLVGEGAHVAAGAVLRSSMLLPGAHVGPGATVERSIIGGRVGAGASVVDVVLGLGHDIGAGDVVADQRIPSS